jgi:hypothetical protein
LELWRHEGEVDELQQRPHFQIGHKGGPQFLTKLIFSAGEGLALALRCEDVKTGNGDQAEEGLCEQELLGDALHGISRGEDGYEFGVGVVKSGPIGKEAIGHEVTSARIVMAFRAVLGYKWAH